MHVARVTFIYLFFLIVFLFLYIKKVYNPNTPGAAENVPQTQHPVQASEPCISVEKYFNKEKIEIT